MTNKTNAEVFDSDEAIALLHTGSHGFQFRNNRGGVFETNLDEFGSNKITTVVEKTK